MLHVDINLPRGVVKRDLVEASEKGGESDEYLRTSQTTISPLGFSDLFGCSERGESCFAYFIPAHWREPRENATMYLSRRRRSAGSTQRSGMNWWESGKMASLWWRMEEVIPTGVFKDRETLIVSVCFRLFCRQLSSQLIDLTPGGIVYSA
jgi:hypothetical protein